MTILSTSWSINDILQWAALGIVMILVAVWIIRRITGKHNSGCDCGCDGCALSDKCRDKHHT